jgi:capsular exopolysaccharide synthesis family protein
VAHTRESTARLERLEDFPEAVQQRVAREPEPFRLAEVPDPVPQPPPHPRPQPTAPRKLERPQRQSGPAHSTFEHKLVVSGNAPSLAVEQYRRLAAAIHDLQVEQGLKTLIVTSALPNEGKTLTAANLALTLSESCEHRVLLIDADLRRPFVHEVFGLPNERGLSDVLRSDDGDLPLVPVSELLSVLPAGHIDQPMALTSERMRTLLEQCAATFDWVLLDAAPVGFMADAQLLARLTRAVLFVIAAHSTPHSLVTRAIGELGPECVIGTVLNRVEEHNIPAASYLQKYYSPDPQAG